MKAKDIRVGGYYKAKVSGGIVTVRVDKIYERVPLTERGSRQYYDVTNLKTGRKTTFRSPAKFRSIAYDPDSTKKLSTEDRRFGNQVFNDLL